MTDPGLARQLSHIGRERARRLFDERRTAVEIEAVYQRVLDTL